MKTISIYILLVSTMIFFCGCDDEIDPGERTSDIVIRGNIYYYDVITGKKIDNNSHIKIAVKEEIMTLE